MTPHQREAQLANQAIVDIIADEVNSLIHDSTLGLPNQARLYIPPMVVAKLMVHYLAAFDAQGTRETRNTAGTLRALLHRAIDTGEL